MPLRTQVLKLTVAVLALHATLVSAEDKALIVGVGDYRDASVTDLRGIAIDIRNMRQALQMMGFKPHQIHVLQDDNATLDNIRATFQRQLINGTTADDRALFYFSGHGTQTRDRSGDEEDQMDEVLMASNTRQLGHQLSNGLVDDELHNLLSRVPARETLVILDACHSGTATKGMQSKAVPPRYQAKFFPWPALLSADNEPMQSSTALRYVALSATHDDELSLASAEGSIFTRGLLSQLAAAQRQGVPLTLMQLRDGIRRYIEQVVPSYKQFTPKLSGNTALKTRFVLLPAVSPTLPGEQAAGFTPGPRWQYLQQLAARSNGVTISTSRPQYRMYEPVQFMLNLPVSGYLNVINVNAADELTILFPNAYERDNRVYAGPLTLPTAGSPYRFTTSPPAGETLTAAFLSSQPLNLYQLELEQAEHQAKTQPFANGTQRGLKVMGTHIDRTLYSGTVRINLQ